MGAAVALTGVIAVLGEQSLEASSVYGGVSQLGAVLLGLGSAFLLRPTHGMSRGGGEALGIAAALLCVLAGTLGSSLLGLTAQALRRATGSGDLERWGGLLRPMPWTGSLALVGLAGTLVLPILGGVTGGWLSMQALITVSTVPTAAHVGVSVPVIGGVALLAAALLGLAATLGIAAVVLTYGLAFLGPPRAEGAATAQECPVPVRAALIVLAAPVVALALAPSGVLTFLHPVLADLTGAEVPGSVALGPLASIQSPPAHGSLFPLGILLCLAGSAGALTLAARWAGHTSTTGDTQRVPGHGAGTEHQGDAVTTAKTDGDEVVVWVPPRFPTDLAAAPLRRLLLKAPRRTIAPYVPQAGATIHRAARVLRWYERADASARGYQAHPHPDRHMRSGGWAHSLAPRLMYLGVLALVLLALIR
jgi:NADH:ubiquinone oxidoreductase subunit 5 (subunit L)/multisubunit Na+/H+ antiporter MnhA subunit